MNRILLGTTALVACGMVAGAANAAEPIALKINGYYDAAFVLHDDDAAGTGDSTVKQDVELNINGSTVLDSGVTVGFVFNIQDQSNNSGTTASATNEQVFAYVEGGMGRTEIGSNEGSAFLMSYVAPYPTDAHGVDTPIFMHISRISSRTNARVTMSAEANKVNYFTPRMSGFQLGASYTPSNDCVGAGGAFGPGGLVYADSCNGNSIPSTFGVRSDADGGVEDILELAANYVGKWGVVDVALSAAYGWGDHESAGLTPGGVGIASPISGDPEAYSLGMNLSTMGWTLGGSWYQSEDLVIGAGAPGAGLPGSDEEAWDLGLTYATGPWQVGVAYLDSETDVAGPGETQLTLFDIGAQYTLGPGVKIGADITLAEDEVPGDGGGPIIESIEDKALALTLMLDF